jgi:hypothetical protein
MKNFVRIQACESAALDMLQGCQVVDASGKALGNADYFLIGQQDRKLKYIDLGRVVISWRSVYFDAARTRLVYYTHS